MNHRTHPRHHHSWEATSSTQKKKARKEASIPGQHKQHRWSPRLRQHHLMHKSSNECCSFDFHLLHPRTPISYDTGPFLLYDARLGWTDLSKIIDPYSSEAHTAEPPSRLHFALLDSFAAFSSKRTIGHLHALAIGRVHSGNSLHLKHFCHLHG